jgi:hypothetical protein
MSAMDPEDEATVVINPARVDEDALTSEYVRPRAAASHRASPSNHTITLTVPALRYLVGMPVVPVLADAPAITSAPAHAAPGAIARAMLAALAVLSVLGAVTLALAASPVAPPEDGAVVVTAYGAGGLPRLGFKVIADGAELCTESPCRFTLEPGDHYVTVVAPGYDRPRARKVIVAAGRESNLHFELTPSL